MRETTRDLHKALEEHYGSEVAYCKGVFWVREPRTRLTIAQARRITGIAATKREPRMVVQPWGDYATIAAFSGYKFS